MSCLRKLKLDWFLIILVLEHGTISSNESLYVDRNLVSAIRSSVRLLTSPGNGLSVCCLSIAIGLTACPPWWWDAALDPEHTGPQHAHCCAASLFIFIWFCGARTSSPFQRREEGITGITNDLCTSRGLWCSPQVSATKSKNILTINMNKPPTPHRTPGLDNELSQSKIHEGQVCRFWVLAVIVLNQLALNSSQLYIW